MIKKNIRKYKIVEKHIELTKSGQYTEAKNLFYLLRKGRIVLGLGDADYNTEIFLEEIGCPVFYDRNGYTAMFKM